MQKKVCYTQTAFQVNRGGFVLSGDIYEGGTAGEKKIPVICSHGFMGNHQEPQPYAIALANEGYLTVTYDFVGGATNGKSQGKTTDMTIYSEMEDLAAVIAYVKSLPNVLPEKLVLMGCSQGGFVSGLYAAAHPGEVAQLILLYPALCIPDDARKGQMLGITFDPEQVPEYLDSVMGFQLSGTYASQVRSIDAIDTISEYPGPVLICCGQKDPIVSYHYMTDLTEALHAKRGTTGRADQSVQIFPVEFAGHGFSGTHQELVNQRILAHMRGLEEILTVDVAITEVTKEEEGETDLWHVGFSALAKNEWFRGKARPGSEDRQRKTKEGFKVEFKADYIMDGFDYASCPCQIHVINRDTGNGWEPTVETDSAALSFLNDQQCVTLADNRPTGPVIHILGSREKLVEPAYIPPYDPVMQLDDNWRENKAEVVFDYCIQDGKDHPVAIICPGGGYCCVCSYVEGKPYAEYLNKQGISAVIVYYRVRELAAYPNPQDDLAEAVRLTLEHAEEYHLDMKHYSVWGSSAGGHLAASFGTESMGYAKYGLPKPEAEILTYPVITMDPTFTHPGTRENLIGVDASEDMTDKTSVEKQVTAAYPPTYIWCGASDQAVPPKNTEVMVEALLRAGVPCETEQFEGVDHGVGLAYGIAAEGWIDKAIAFWKKQMQ